MIGCLKKMLLAHGPLIDALNRYASSLAIPSPRAAVFGVVGGLHHEDSGGEGLHSRPKSPCVYESLGDQHPGRLVSIHSEKEEYNSVQRERRGGGPVQLRDVQ